MITGLKLEKARKNGEAMSKADARLTKKKIFFWEAKKVFQNHDPNSNF